MSFFEPSPSTIFETLWMLWLIRVMFAAICGKWTIIGAKRRNSTKGGRTVEVHWLYSCSASCFPPESLRVFVESRAPRAPLSTSLKDI